MKRKTRIAISLLSGLAAVLVALAYATTVRDEADRERNEVLAKYGGEMVQVCVATRDIEPGEPIDEGNTEVEPWVATLLPRDAETSMDAVTGKVATSRIPKRAVLCPRYFETSESGVEVPAGKVAVSVASSAERALGGALERDAEVDVYVSLDGVVDRLCAARVLDTSALAEGGGQLAWVTLAVDADRVGELLAAAAKAQVTLVIPGSGVSAGDVAGRDAEKAADGAADKRADAKDETTEGDGRDG